MCHFGVGIQSNGFEKFNNRLFIFLLGRIEVSEFEVGIREPRLQAHSLLEQGLG